jgi:hypothetical protein
MRYGSDNACLLFGRGRVSITFVIGRALRTANPFHKNESARQPLLASRLFSFQSMPSPHQPGERKDLPSAQLPAVCGTLGLIACAVTIQEVLHEEQDFISPVD